jgi:hypothetical protein
MSEEQVLQVVTGVVGGLVLISLARHPPAIGRHHVDGRVPTAARAVQVVVLLVGVMGLTSGLWDLWKFVRT